MGESQLICIGQRSRRSMQRLRVALVGLLVAATMGALALPARADGWIGWRDCRTYETCKVRSYGLGYVEHLRDGVVKASWSNPTFRWRTSFHGSGYQEVFIWASVDLRAQSAVCVCASWCPE